MKLRCPLPTCRQTFQWDASNKWPNDCPVCGAFIGTDGTDAVCMPYIALKGGAFAKSVDNVYNDAVKASELRMEQAAAMTPGASASDFNDLKITNYRPGMVEGESAVKAPETSQAFKDNVARLQSAGVPVMPGGGMQLTGQAAAYSASTRAGLEPNAGARAMNRLRSAHASSVDPRMNGAVSSLPALETQQPGYAPRV